jgi:hypothetical protein
MGQRYLVSAGLNRHRPAADLGFMSGSSQRLAMQLMRSHDSSTDSRSPAYNDEVNMLTAPWRQGREQERSISCVHTSSARRARG